MANGSPHGCTAASTLGLTCPPPHPHGMVWVPFTMVPLLELRPISPIQLIEAQSNLTLCCTACYLNLGCVFIYSELSVL